MENEINDPPPSGMLYFVRVSTGCSCCREQNFIEGPYRSRDEAQKWCEHHHKRATLSSQFADNGHQDIIELEYERAGNWLIIDKQYAVPISALEAPDQLSFFEKDYRL